MCLGHRVLVQKVSHDQILPPIRINCPPVIKHSTLDYSKTDFTLTPFDLARAMDKSVHTEEYEAFLRLLRQAREDADVTQVDLADKLGITQSHLSKMERGELRLDVIQTREICLALGTTLPCLVSELEELLGR